MNNAEGPIGHSFHIPVMGTGFTIDTPLKTARYGISSVISLVDDHLIEQMRKHHCQEAGESYLPIEGKEEDSRARRITAYLDLLDHLIKIQATDIKASPFEPGSDITRYFELLPEGSVKDSYRAMLIENDPAIKAKLQDELRDALVVGGIDVNIMTKLDRDLYEKGEKLAPEFADAMSALRGFALSTVEASMVMSAGMNPRLYTYMAKFDDFFADSHGNFKKKIVLKVSDFRSARIQGKFLAKRGLWVSEFRIESGMNCGGHAFPTKGNLMGPILQEFVAKKNDLSAELHKIYVKTLTSMGRPIQFDAPPVRLTVQGGIGTAEEDRLLLDHYGLDATGWGTPFMLVPEATNVDDEHLKLLMEAREKDILLSDASPLGIKFWNLINSASENARRLLIANDSPGSTCTKGHARVNTEFTEKPICIASNSYQKLKLDDLAKSDIGQARLADARRFVMDKSCICRDLGGSAKIKHAIEPDALPSVCCGPNIVNFSKTVSLDDMIGHIYGRLSIMAESNRPHMFIRELMLYVDHYKTSLDRLASGLPSEGQQYLTEFRANLLEGIEYYRDLAQKAIIDGKDRFVEGLEGLRQTLEPVRQESAA